MVPDGNDLAVGRRPFLRSAGVVLTGGTIALAGCSVQTDMGTGDSINDDPTSTPTPTPERYDSEMERRAAEYIYETYNNVEGSDGAEIIDHFESFVNDPDLAQEFIDQQLGYFLDLPENPDKPLVRNLKYEVMNRKLLYKDDWTSTGNPHILPDGSEGPGHHYRHVEEEGFDGDMLSPRWTNFSMQVFDPKKSGEERENWVYVGPQQHQGDRVGKIGGHQEFMDEEEALKWSIAYYADQEVKPEDLVGRRVSMLWWEEVKNKDGSTTVGQESIKLMQKVFQEAPIRNKDGSKGVTLLTHEGKKLPYKPETSGLEALSNLKSNIPNRLIGSTNYILYSNELSKLGAAGIPISYKNTDGGIHNKDTDPEFNASGALHEVYGHGVAEIVGHESDTFMTGNGESLEVDLNQWRQILEEINLLNKSNKPEGLLSPAYDDIYPGELTAGNEELGEEY